MFEAYLLGCAVGVALLSGFDLGMFIAWITERPDTPRVVSRGRVVPLPKAVGDGFRGGHVSNGPFASGGRLFSDLLA
jgi:hypothetical protein